MAKRETHHAISCCGECGTECTTVQNQDIGLCGNCREKLKDQFYAFTQEGMPNGGK